MTKVVVHPSAGYTPEMLLREVQEQSEIEHALVVYVANGTFYVAWSECQPTIVIAMGSVAQWHGTRRLVEGD